jgi:hypothetical protein
MFKIRLLPPSSQEIWLDRFGARLMLLQPKLKPLDAAHEAVSIYPDAADLDPEEAAEIFAVQ